MDKLKINKKKLLSLLNKNLNEMAMDFDGSERPNVDVINKLANNDTPISKVPLPKTGNEPNQNFQELLASERYKKVVEDVKRYTGVNGDISTNNAMGQLTMMMYNAHFRIIELERNHKEQLEQLAKELVYSEMGISENDITVNAKLLSSNEIDGSDIDRTISNDNPQEPEIGNDIEIDAVEIEVFNDLVNLDLERSKRRLINAIIQGAARKGLFMYHFVSDKLRELTGSDELFNLYGIMMSINDLNYWQFSDDAIDMAGDEKAGKMDIERPEGDDEEEGNDKTTINAVGVNFPVLIHEILKGIYETVGVYGQPKDEELNRKVGEHEDTLQKETWDLRLGPAIWERIINQFPDDVLLAEGKMIQLHIFMTLFELPAKQFLTLMREIISGSDNGKRLLGNIIVSIKQRLQNEEYEDTIQQFNQDLEQITDETDNDELNNLLNDLGIKPPKTDDEEDDEDFLNQFR
jgi:hypothetical protein